MASSMNIAPLMEKSLSVEGIFFTNLLLLGFDVVSNEQKYKIPFNKQMFRTANVRGMEVILHFLFVQLYPQKSHEIFKLVWPIMDRQQAVEFRNICHNLLVDLEKEKHLPIASSQKSNLQTCSGQKFYHLLWKLSSHVLKVVMQNSCPEFANKVPSIPTIEYGAYQKLPALFRATQLHISNQSERFISHAKEVVQTQNEWREYDNSLGEEYGALLDEKFKLEEERKGLASKKTASLPLSEEAREKSIQKIQQVWADVGKYIDETKNVREMLERVMKNNGSLYSIDSKNLQLGDKIPEIITQESPQELQKVVPIIEGKLNLSCVIDLCSLGLDSIDKRLDEINNQSPSTIETLRNDQPVLNNLVSSHQQHLSSLQLLNATILSDISKIKNEIRELRVRSLLGTALSTTSNINNSLLSTNSINNNNNNNNNFNNETQKWIEKIPQTPLREDRISSPHTPQTPLSKMEFNAATLSTPHSVIYNATREQVLEKLAQSVRRVTEKNAQRVNNNISLALPSSPYSTPSKTKKQEKKFGLERSEIFDDDTNLNLNTKTVNTTTNTKKNTLVTKRGRNVLQGQPSQMTPPPKRGPAFYYTGGQSMVENHPRSTSSNFTSNQSRNQLPITTPFLHKNPNFNVDFSTPSLRPATTTQKPIVQSSSRVKRNHLATTKPLFTAPKPQINQVTQQEKKRNVEVTDTKVLPRNSKPLSTPFVTPILPSKIEKGFEDLASQFADSIYNGNENEDDHHFSTPFHFQTSPLEALSKEAFSTKKQLPRTPATKPSPFIDESNSIDESHIDAFSTIQTTATTTSTTTTTTTTTTSSQEKGHIGHENKESHVNAMMENLNVHDLGRRRKTMSTPYKTPPRSLSMDYIINTSKEDEDSLFENNNTNVDSYQQMLFSPDSPLPSSFGALGNKEVVDDLDWTKYMESPDKFDDFDIDG